MRALFVASLLLLSACQTTQVRFDRDLDARPYPPDCQRDLTPEIVNRRIKVEYVDRKELLRPGRDPGLGMEIIGRYDVQTNTISIANDLSDLRRRDTLQHELVHAVCRYWRHS